MNRKPDCIRNNTPVNDVLHLFSERIHFISLGLSAIKIRAKLYNYFGKSFNVSAFVCNREYANPMAKNRKNEI